MSPNPISNHVMIHGVPFTLKSGKFGDMDATVEAFDALDRIGVDFGALLGFTDSDLSIRVDPARLNRAFKHSARLELLVLATCDIPADMQAPGALTAHIKDMNMKSVRATVETLVIHAVRFFLILSYDWELTPDAWLDIWEHAAQKAETTQNDSNPPPSMDALPETCTPTAEAGRTSGT